MNETYDKLKFTEQGAQVLWKHKDKTCTLAWLVGEADDFKESGQYDIIVPEDGCLLYTSPSPRDGLLSRMPSSA